MNSLWVLCELHIGSMNIILLWYILSPQCLLLLVACVACFSFFSVLLLLCILLLAELLREPFII